MIRTTIPGGKWLDSPAAASFERCLADGAPNEVKSAGRSWDYQAYLYALYGYPRAVPPAASKHVKGNAIDATAPLIAWFNTHGKAYGWVQTVTAEPWHFEYFAAKDQHRHRTTTQVAQEDDHMAAFSVHARIDAKEWTLGHADIGSDLAPFSSPTTPAMRRTVYTESGGVVVEYRGFMVTTIEAIGVAWARTYANGVGGETSRVAGGDYVAIQRALSLTAQASASSRPTSTGATAVDVKPIVEAINSVPAKILAALKGVSWSAK